MITNWLTNQTSALLGWPSGECSLLKKIQVTDSKDHQTLLVLTQGYNTDWHVPITHAAMIYIYILIY